MKKLYFNEGAMNEEIVKIRKEIDQIDKKIVELLDRRVCKKDWGV